jgi:ferredoxin
MLIVELDRCNGCGVCVESCPQGAPILKNGKAHFASSLCVGCQTCVDVCPTGAIQVASPTGPRAEAALAIPLATRMASWPGVLVPIPNPERGASRRRDPSRGRARG